MNETILFFTGVILLIILFTGDPDISDAIRCNLSIDHRPAMCEVQE